MLIVYGNCTRHQAVVIEVAEKWGVGVGICRLGHCQMLLFFKGNCVSLSMNNEHINSCTCFNYLSSVKYYHIYYYVIRINYF